MELRQLEYFLAITESGAFSRAAMKLSVAQPVLSRQIKALEDTLGAKLYFRTGRGIALTEAGSILEKHARTIIDTRSVAENEIAALARSPSGHVTIGMPPSVAAALAASVVERFSEQFPNVRLSVVEGFSAHVLDWLLAGQIDIAILYDTPHSKALSADELLTDELFLLGPIGDPYGLGDRIVSTPELGSIPLILASRPHGLRLLIDSFLARLGGVVANVRIEMDALPTTLSLVEAGLGYTVLSYASVHGLVSAGRIRHWRLEPTIRRKLILASSTLRPSTESSRAVAGIVRKHAQMMVRTGQWAPQV